MKKIGILTFHGADNLGAVLQAYALCEFIDKEINFRTEIIDYECEEVEKTRYVQGGNFVKKIPLALYYRIPLIFWILLNKKKEKYHMRLVWGLQKLKKKK